MQRRTFVSGTGAALALGLLHTQRLDAETNRTVELYMTSADKRHTSLGPVPLNRSTGALRGERVEIRLQERFQPMLGFGCAYTDSSCYLLSTMPTDARRKFLEETFSSQAMNLSVGRTTIGASDYSRTIYNYDDVAGDVAMKHFSVQHDEAYILPILREMRQVNPSLFLLSTPWSPPGWMKTYGSMLGGWMQTRYLAPYAMYFEKFLDAYQTAGVSIDAVTSQNELEFDQNGTMPATFMPPEMESDFIRDHLGPMLARRSKPVQIWLLDHNYDLWKRVRWQLQDPELRPFVSGVAWHPYVGKPEMISQLHAADPDIPFYFTEGGPDITDPKYLTEWTRWGKVFSEAIENWCRCIITWNLMLDPKGRPQIGGFECGGLVTLNADNSLTYSAQYWVLRHFSQHVQRGAVRVASKSYVAEVVSSAFRNQDGSAVVVLTNTDKAREVYVDFGPEEALIKLDEQSVTTIVLKT